MQKVSNSTSILCVDDEPGILQAYVDCLSGAGYGGQEKELDNLLQRRRQRKETTADNKENRPRSKKRPAYNLFTASSGEAAVEVVREELKAGRQIAAGFFDMAMPGGIDGTETIKQILELDPQMLCAVVTAYTDRSPEQLSVLFNRQDDWLYFNKPFSAGELQQTAYHLVTAWNQRRREEMLVSQLRTMRNGLIGILDSVNDINRVPPMMLDNVLVGVLDHFLKLVNADDGFIHLPDGVNRLCIGRGEYEVCDEVWKKTTKKRQWQLAERVMKKKESIIKKNMVGTPLMIDQEVYGVIFVEAQDEIFHDTTLFDMYAIQAINMIQHSRLYEELDQYNDELTRKNQELVELLSKLAQTENMRKQFEKLSMIDGLTGILNRRALDMRIGDELERARRHHLKIACLMMDIDFFKKINDTFGHAAGDYVLKEICKIFRLCKRRYDVLGRYGGEEFCIFLKDVDHIVSEKICGRILESVGNHKFRFKEHTIPVTLSIGCTHVKPKKNNHTTDSILQLADKALYKAKRKGRNQVCFI